MTAPALAPQRAEGLELLGALGGSGYRGGTTLVRRADGQSVQLTPLLYAVLEAVDGSAGPHELAEVVSARTDRLLSADDVTTLLGKLSDLGLLRGSEGAAAPASNPLLALRWKAVVSSPGATRRLTAPFAWLFTPVVVWPVLAAFVGVCWFVLVEKGLASATRSAFDTPGLLLAVFALAVVSAGFHELGHAAACRYGGARPGAMGVGLYLVWPAFYTNVDDAYRLDRRGRLRVDLGGLYFNAVVAVVVTCLWVATGEDALLLGVATQLVQMVHQLTPVLRADGYHILADWTGVPDLFAHLGPTLRRLLPWHWGTPSPLTRRARLLVTAWVALVVPVLASLLLTAVLVFPRLVATAWGSGRVQAARLEAAAEQADLLGVGAGLLRLLALLLPVAGTVLVVGRLVHRTSTRTWQRTEDRPLARTAAVLSAAVALAALAWAWWPDGQYRPVRDTDRGTVSSLLSARSAPSVTPVTRPVSAERQLALALVPKDRTEPTLLLLRDADGTTRTVLAGADGGTGRALPFSLPGDLRPGEARALATNTKDGSVVYDVAYALVTVTDGAPVTTVNDAWALASCSACTTVAVSFQVVLVVGHSDLVAPVNAAVAANGGCLRCVTSALAVQLVVSVSELPSDQVRAQLEAALAQLDDPGSLRPADLVATVDAVQAEVVGILTDAGIVTATTSSTVTATASPSASTSATATSSPSPSPSPTTTSGPSPTPTGSASPTPEPSASPTGTTLGG